MVPIRALSHPFLGGLAPVDGAGSPTATMDLIFGSGKWKPNKGMLALVKMTGGKDVDSQQLFVEPVPMGAKVATLGLFGLAGVIGYWYGKR
jgi:hypothetical protein